MGTFVPPGGFAGFAQMTPATQSLLSKKKRKKTTRKKKVAKRGRPATKKKKASTPKKTSGKRLVKGSPAAKARMKKLRAMQKRK